MNLKKTCKLIWRKLQQKKRCHFFKRFSLERRKKLQTQILKSLILKMSVRLQKSALTQPRTSPPKFPGNGGPSWSARDDATSCRSIYSQSLRLSPYETNWDYFRAVLEIVFCLILAYYIFKEACTLGRTRRFSLLKFGPGAVSPVRNQSWGLFLTRSENESHHALRDLVEFRFIESKRL